MNCLSRSLAGPAPSPPSLGKARKSSKAGTRDAGQFALPRKRPSVQPPAETGEARFYTRFWRRRKHFGRREKA